MHPIAHRVYERFRQQFGATPLLIRSPGRINLIGEHTDYNDGFVLPGAIDRAIYFALGPAPDHQCTVLAIDLDDTFTFSLERLDKTPKRWPNYLMGVVDQLLKGGYPVQGFFCVFGGDIPIAAGLSSSAALETGLAFGLNQVFGLQLSPMELVQLARRAENAFVGVQCGIMDQLTNIFARANQVLFLDCRSLDFQYIPFPDSRFRIVLCDTRKPRELAISEYNARRRECEQAVAFFQSKGEDVVALRDVTPELCRKYAQEMDAILYRRALFVSEENNRVVQAVEALKQQDFATLGRLLFESHHGLQNLYEVSCPELDFLVEVARSVPGVMGARLMGAGFGGCTINLVQASAVEAFVETVSRQFQNRFGVEPACYPVSLEAGTQTIRIIQ